MSQDTALALATALERDSDHPIALSLREAAETRKLDVPQTETIKSLTGLGLRGQVDGQSVLLGAARLMQAEKHRHRPAGRSGNRRRATGGNPRFILP